ncbi:hypothetical protein BB558_004313 [Smittium angustum]|uniref:DUF202 domain-containing protein n=1 Tax=Smittium angustum TaxID=133377 RepID=A0A2U1J3Q5_SMIAN|nr:hypothetical protein BB558_004313 [Smittium angustum]
MSKLQTNPNLIATKGHSFKISNESYSERDALLSKNVGKSRHPEDVAMGTKPSGPKSLEAQNLESIPKKKKLAVPVRVEPKVFFANERTFLSWLNFSVLLGTISLGLVNFGDKRIRIAGFGFTTVSIIFMVYSLHLYQRRATMILNREPGPYGNLFFL